MNWHHCESEDFLPFLQEQLLYRKIVKVEEHGDEQTVDLTLDNGVVLRAHGNEGCGGCGNGWYFLTHVETCDNAIMGVEILNEQEERYSVFVMTEDKRINMLTYEGYDNGYYGVGFYLEVIRKENEENDY